MWPVSRLPWPDREEYWTVEKKGGFWNWSVDSDGPHTLYKTREEALTWATILKLVHDRVRIRHTVNEYEEM